MIRRLAPRRLGTDEEATVVEHLTELRHRLLIVVVAIVPAFLVTFDFHTTLIEWLKRPLPADKTLVTLGVVEPFTTAVKVSGLAAIAIVLPILVWQVWGFLAPAVDQATQRVLRRVHRRRDGALRDRRRVRVLRRAAGGDHVPRQLRRHALQRPDPRELLPLVHLARAASPAASRSRCRSSSSRSSGSASSATTSCAATAGSGYVADDRVRDPAAHRRPRLAACSRRSRC